MSNVLNMLEAAQALRDRLRNVWMSMPDRHPDELAAMDAFNVADARLERLKQALADKPKAKGRKRGAL